MHQKIHLGSAPHSECTLGKEYYIMSHDSLKNVLNRKAKDDGNDGRGSSGDLEAEIL